MFELFDPSSETRLTTGTNLPHWFQPGVTYFVTWRTADSIPCGVSKTWHRERDTWIHENGLSPREADWKEKLQQLPVEKRRQYHNTFSKQFMEYLDKGHGDCVLKDPELQKVVADSLFKFDNDRYHLGNFVVMPNHVHIIVGLVGDTDIVKQCYSWKKFTASSINRQLGRKGRFWQADSFDHLIRSLDQLDAVKRYIKENPKHLPADQYYLYQRK